VKPGLPRLHIVTDETIARLPDLSSRARIIAAAGSVALHARDPSAGGRALHKLAQTLASAPAALFVNDRVDVAVAVDAAGIHLPADGLGVEAARRLAGTHRWIGRSTHNSDDAGAAIDEGADYVFLGPIWQTRSHPERKPLGLQAIRAAGSGRVIAIGGITPERIEQCMAAGAYGVAVISAVWDASDPGTAVGEMMVSLDRYRG
jgi:thiamine-phosphate pyrophosphorylase